MTVAELIAQLQALPGETLVLSDMSDYGYSDKLELHRVRVAKQLEYNAEDWPIWDEVLMDSNFSEAVDAVVIY